MPLLPNAAATRYRPAAQTIGPDRRPVAKSYTSSSLAVHHEPASEDDRQVLPEGVRAMRARVVFCAPSSLRLPDLTARTEADEVAIPGTIDAGGGRYVVMHLELHRDGIIPHDRAICVAVQELGPEVSS